MHLRRFLFLWFAVLTLGPPVVLAQGSRSGTVTSTQCVTIDVTSQSTVGIQVTGTWTGTLQPKLSIQGQAAANLQVTPTTSSTSQSTITGNGLFQARVAGGTTFQLCGATVTSGTANIWLNASTAVSLNGLGNGGVAASIAYSGITSGANTSAVMQNDTGSSTAPLNLGQLAGNQIWMPVGLLTPAGVGVLTGGNISSGHIVAIAYTLNSAAGETRPSGTISASMSGATYGAVCTSGVICSFTFTAPTIPPGYTGYTPYWCDTSVAACSAPVRVNACINITTNCTITTANLNSGVALPTSNTAFVQPSPMNATNLCPTGSNVFGYTQLSDNTFQPYAAIDASSAPNLPSPYGTLTYCNRLFINDSGQNILDGSQQGGGPMRTTLFMVAHKSGRSFTPSAAIDDRVISVRGTDTDAGAADYHQWLGYYGEQFVYNSAFTCSPIGNNGQGEDCIAAIRARSNVQVATVANITGVVGIHGTASTNVAAPNIGSCAACVIGVAGSAGQETVTNQNTSASYVGVSGYANANGTSAGAAAGYAFWAYAPTTRFTQANKGLLVQNFGTNVADWNITSRGAAGDATAGKNFMAGGLYLPAILSSGGGIAVSGSLSPQAVKTVQLSGTANANIANIGVAGATTDTYKVICRDVNGGTLPTGASPSTTTANATLNGSNFNRLTIATTQQPQGCVTYDIYRTVAGGTPSSLGKIGSVSASSSASEPVVASGYATTLTFDDTGLAGDTTAAPVVNTTGSAVTANFVRGTNTVRVASNFTTAANTNLQAITGLTWTFIPTAQSYSFHCSLTYSQGTANAAVAFGIQSVTAAPTNIFANGTQQITVGPPATFTTGTLATLTTTTATAIVSGTPGATATNYVAQLDGTIENPAAENTAVVMVSTATAADAVTVLRGSYCSITP
jgi:hypothetical protein